MKPKWPLKSNKKGDLITVSLLGMIYLTVRNFLKNKINGRKKVF
jgi:hypothetical protein